MKQKHTVSSNYYTLSYLDTNLKAKIDNENK